MTGDEYVALLLERQAEAPLGPYGCPVPLEYLVRPGDEDLFTPPAEAPQPKRETAPRTYRPASHWAERLALLEAEMRRYETPVLPDRAAAGGVGLGVRASARVQQREDSRLARYAELTRRAAGLRERHERAVRREAAFPTDLGRLARSTHDAAEAAGSEER